MTETFTFTQSGERRYESYDGTNYHFSSFAEQGSFIYDGVGSVVKLGDRW